MLAGVNAGAILDSPAAAKRPKKATAPAPVILPEKPKKNPDQSKAIQNLNRALKRAKQRVEGLLKKNKETKAVSNAAAKALQTIAVQPGTANYLLPTTIM